MKKEIRLTSNSKTGLTGVTHSKRYYAKVMHKGVNHCLGGFNTPAEASAAYKTAKTLLKSFLL